jgi:hypothetical protein
MEQNKEVWIPKFFKEVDHPHVRMNEIGEKQVQFEMIRNDPNGYWERRSRGDWSGLSNLWGPFDKTG